MWLVKIRTQNGMWLVKIQTHNGMWLVTKILTQYNVICCCKDTNTKRNVTYYKDIKTEFVQIWHKGLSEKFVEVNMERQNRQISWM